MKLEEAISHLDDILSNKEWDCEEYRAEHIQLREYLAELQEYRKAILNNTLIKLPCKVGDTVWCIDGGIVRGTKVKGFALWECENKIIGNVGAWDFNEVGKTVFLTREEAEKALKERENDG